MIAISRVSDANLAAQIAALEALLAKKEGELTTLRVKLVTAELRIEKLELERRKRLREKYGPASERLSDEQLLLLEEEPGVSAAEVQAESERGPLAAAVKPEPVRKPHPGRRPLPAHLERKEKMIAVPETERQCASCGREMAVIGYEESEQLEVIPAERYVLVTRREKRACAGCKRQGVRTAPAPERIVDKCLLSDRSIVEAIVAKYCDHLPLYRQSVILERDCGVEIHRATLDGIVLRAGELLLPLVRGMRQQILASGYVQADETPVPVQWKQRKGREHQAYLWQYGTPGGEAVFDFRLGRGREGPKEVLRDYGGLLQTDGYAAYEHCGDEARVVRAACWAHARRGFFDALKLNPLDAGAVRLIEQIDALFAMDRQAREQQLPLAERHGLRQKQARPLLIRLKEDLEATATKVLPASTLGKAIQYTLGLWLRLTAFLEHPRLELSNNLAENSMRPVVLGRKNWIHIGHPGAGAKVAAICSVVESCRRLKIPVREYLQAVLPGLADRSHRQLIDLTPAAWLAVRQQA